MSTNIYEYNGTLLVTIADGTINTTASPLQIPGKGYTNYGAPVMQDILWVMQNFAGPTAPTPQLQGMLWYNSNTNALELYTGSTWVKAFKSDQTNLPAVDDTYDLGSAGTRFRTVYAYNINAANITGDSTLFHTNQTNLPTVNQTYDLGSNSYQFHNIYGQTLYATTVNATTVNASNFVGDTTLMRTNQTNVPTATNAYDLGAAGTVYANVYATTFHGVATSAEYADVAERYASDEPLEVGDVVTIGGEAEITKTTIDADINVFGVISDKPALKMNDAAGDDDTHPLVALLGRTPVKLIGPVGKGQRVVSSDTPGVARAAGGDEPNLAILGRSLEAKQSSGIELVEIVIGRQ
jgi:hypothetical protein